MVADSKTTHPPSIDACARSLADLALPQPLLVDACRQAVAAGDPASARAIASGLARSLLQPVVNATGVLLHTNLGRSPVALAADGRRGANVELDLSTGRRGRRGRAVATLLRRLTGAAGATVVNNGAAAVLLALAALARDRAVVVSRGELVEIGGGFRIPEVLAASGAHMVEVGTTNRTRLADYADAIATHDPALILKVHQSNYKMVGFCESVSVRALCELGVPVVVDLGSGLLDATTPWLTGGPPTWLGSEPAVRQTLAEGAALAIFSGDKLLGGPQAGIIAGDEALVESCARHPLARALRPGGLVLHALQETLLAYLHRDPQAIAFWRMAGAGADEIRRRAAAVAALCSGATVVECTSVAGGGSLPGVEIASAGVAIPGDHRAALRELEPPVIATVRGDQTVCDLRTVDPADDHLVAAALATVLEHARADAPAHLRVEAGELDTGQSPST